MQKFAISANPVPLFNKPNIAEVFSDEKGLQSDPIGLVRELEMLAFAGSCFEIHEQIDEFVVRIACDAYPVSEHCRLYTDIRFLDLQTKRPSPTSRPLPRREVVIENLYRSLGKRYVWGGNYMQGLPQMIEYYPPPQNADIDYWALKGVDCSGLLYEATGGNSARNTRALVNYGKPVDIAGLSFKEIINIAQPTDYIAWHGHVVIFIDTAKIIQSRHNPLDKQKHYSGGVYIEDAYTVLEELCAKKEAVSDSKYAGADKFVMRRIYER